MFQFQVSNLNGPLFLRLSLVLSRLLSFSVPLCPCLSLRVLLLVVVSCVHVVVVVVCACGVGWHAENPRAYIQNVPVCTGTTPACGNTCGRRAGTHGDVLNVHTGGVPTERGAGEGGTHTHQHPHTAHQQQTQHTTHKTEHARCHRQFCLPKFAHVRLSPDARGSPKKTLDLIHSQFENRSRTTCPSFLQTFALPDKVAQLHLS